MVHAQLADAIIDSFPSPTLSKHPGKPEYTSIQETFCLLTANVVLIESPHAGGQNNHLGLVLKKTRYALVIQVPLVRPTNPGFTPKILRCTTPFDEKAILREHLEQR